MRQLLQNRKSGLRLGYIYGQEDVVRKCAIGKQGSDLHTSNLTQAVVDRFLRQGLLEPHIQAILPDIGTS